MSTPAASEPRFVTLPGLGILAPVEAFTLLLDLERRDFTLTRDGDVLIVGPAEQLTSEDCAAIRRWKPHLFALMAYHAPEAG